MGETPYFNSSLTHAINGLNTALHVKGNILNDSEITDLTTLGVSYWDDTQATGISGCYNGTKWTKGAYQKAVYMEQSEEEYKAREKLPNPEAERGRSGFLLFTATVKKVTSDADWRKEIWERKRRDQAYKRESARTLRDIWYTRMYATPYAPHSFVA